MKSNANMDSYNQNDSVIRFTPRQLIKYHMEHPEIPITDEDINNLIFDLPTARHWRDKTESLQQDSNINYINNNNNLTATMLL